MSSSAITWTKRIGAMLVLLVAIGHLVQRIQLIDDPRIDLGGAEINVVYGIQKIMLDRPLYEDPEQPPFDVMQYAPLYYHVVSACGNMLGVDHHDTGALFALSRTCSLIFNLLTCLFVFVLCRKLGADAWLSVACGAITLCLFTSHFYGRPDSLYAALFVAAFGTFLLGKTRTAIVWSGALVILCVFTKQTGVLVVLIIMLVLLLRRNWRDLLTFSIIVLTGVITGCALLLTDATPHVLWANMVQGVSNGFGGTMYHELFDQGVFKFHAGWFILAATTTYLHWQRGDAGRGIAIALVSSLCFGLFSGLKYGSNLNYLFEAYLITVVGAASIASSSPQGLVPFLFAQCLFFGAHSMRNVQRWMGRDEFATKHAALDRFEDEKLYEELVRSHGLAPKDHVFITYRGHLELLLNGQGLLAQKDIIEWSTAPLYDYTSFERMMDEGSVRFIITDGPLDTLHFMQRSWGPLRPVAQINSRFVYSLPTTR